MYYREKRENRRFDTYYDLIMAVRNGEIVRIDGEKGYLMENAISDALLFVNSDETTTFMFNTNRNLTDEEKQKWPLEKFYGIGNI